jgi:fatty acid desaturase
MRERGACTEFTSHRSRGTFHPVIGRRPPPLRDADSPASFDARRDPRLRDVRWRDLTTLSSAETVKELLLPLPWLAASLAFAHCRLWPLALAMSFLFFLTGLRVVHGAYHYALGLPRRATEWVMFGFSILMLGSMHAIQWNHLRHHRDCLKPDDIEAMGAHRSAFGAILLGPRFPFRLHHAALVGSSGTRRAWIVAELAANGVWLGLLPGAIPCGALRHHVLAMAIGQCLTAFFAVWTVHHGCSATGTIARTIRSPGRSAVTFGMFFHLEHHLFPMVPTPRLPILARRLDEAAPRSHRPLVW